VANGAKQHIARFTFPGKGLGCNEHLVLFVVRSSLTLPSLGAELVVGPPARFRHSRASALLAHLKLPDRMR